MAAVGGLGLGLLLLCLYNGDELLFADWRDGMIRLCQPLTLKIFPINLPDASFRLRTLVSFHTFRNFDTFVHRFFPLLPLPFFSFSYHRPK